MFVRQIMTCPECHTPVEQLHFCDGCFARCCGECSLTISPLCEHPTDVWLVPVTVTKTLKGVPLRYPRRVLRETHVAPYGHMWRIGEPAG